MKIRICSECGTHNVATAWSCTNCGETLSINTIVELDDESVELVTAPAESTALKAATVNADALQQPAADRDPQYSASVLSIELGPALIPLTWEIQTAEGRNYMGLDQATIVEGLKQRWLGLDDRIRKGQDSWQSIRSLGDVKAITDPVRTHAEDFANRGAVLFALISVFGGSVYLAMANLGLSFGQAILLTIVPLTIIFIFFVSFNIMILAITIFVGVPIMSAITGLPPTAFVNGGFILGTLIRVILLAIGGYAIGYGVGYAVGGVRGLLVGDRFLSPDGPRQSAPESVVSRSKEQAESYKEFHPAQVFVHISLDEQERKKVLEALGQDKASSIKVETLDSRPWTIEELEMFALEHLEQTNRSHFRNHLRFQYGIAYKKPILVVRTKSGIV